MGSEQGSGGFWDRNKVGPGTATSGWRDRSRWVVEGLSHSCAPRTCPHMLPLEPLPCPTATVACLPQASAQTSLPQGASLGPPRPPEAPPVTHCHLVRYFVLVHPDRQVMYTRDSLGIVCSWLDRASARGALSEPLTPGHPARRSEGARSLLVSNE